MTASFMLQVSAIEKKFNRMKPKRGLALVGGAAKDVTNQKTGNSDATAEENNLLCMEIRM